MRFAGNIRQTRFDLLYSFKFVAWHDKMTRAFVYCDEVWNITTHKKLSILCDRRLFNHLPAISRALCREIGSFVRKIEIVSVSISLDTYLIPTTLSDILPGTYEFVTVVVTTP